MMTAIKNEKGFTLTEGLISLFIISIVTTISFTFLIHIHDYLRLNQIMTMLTTDLHYIRDVNMIPMGQETRVSLRFYPQEDKYVILSGNEIVKTRNFPNNINLINNTGSNTITFSEMGNLGQGRTLTFQSRFFTRLVVFSVGVGGFEVR